MIIGDDGNVLLHARRDNEFQSHNLEGDELSGICLANLCPNFDSA